MTNELNTVETRYNKILGTEKCLLYIRYFVVSVVNKQYKTRKLIHWEMGMEKNILLYSGTSLTYNEVPGTIKITLLYQVSHYIRVKKQRNIKSWDQQNYLVIRGFYYIRPLYNEVPLYYVFCYIRSLYIEFPLIMKDLYGIPLNCVVHCICTKKFPMANRLNYDTVEPRYKDV